MERAAEPHSLGMLASRIDFSPMSPERSTISGSDSGWEAFAAREPYFAVLTAAPYLRANLTEEREREFFASGENYVEWLLHLIDRHLVKEFAPMSTLEYGCGIGRLAIPFARRPGRVFAVDRSPTMLETARREASRQGITHIEFQTPSDLFASGRQFDLINCYGVFQRLRPADGLALLGALVGCLGAGGVGVFHFPYRTRTSLLVETSRRLRARLPIVNRFVNVLRGKPFDEPFIEAHAYALDDVFRTLDDAFRARYWAPIAATHLLFENQQGFSAFIACVEAPREHARPRAGGPAPVSPHARETVAVRQLIARTSVEELNQAAEEYFSTLKNWEHHLTKPFNNPDETPTLLIGVATMLQGLRLAPGMTVLEFGAGTGWLSRFLTQLGCRLILLDVSPSALAIARELYERQPIIGERPQPRFMTFDGRRIDLPDGSVDRILSFHAFHHVPEPDAMLQEFGRLLKPGGVAGFVEPGSTHSHDPQSQFEMRAHGVVENDVDVHEIWRTARECGFADMKLAVHHTPPFHASLNEWEDFLADSGAGERWVNSTRAFLRHVRTFFLFKEGAERLDSRAAGALACTLEAALVSRPALEREPMLVDVTVRNRGAAVWLRPEAEYGGVALGAHLYHASGKLLAFDFHRQHLTEPSREIAPGETVSCRLTLPPQPAGKYVVELDCVSSNVIWFSQVGSQPARIAIDIAPLA
jgi:SAM-dependent methyltransferase